MSDDLSGFSLMELFRLESEGQAAILSSGLLELEADPAVARPETLEQLMRAAHSLKGAARIVGVDTAVRVAHAMEDAFVAAQKGAMATGPPHVDVLLRALDLLTRTAQVADDDLARWQQEREPEVVAAVADLKALLTGEPPAPAAAAAEADLSTTSGVASPAGGTVPPYEGGIEGGSSPSTPTTATGVQDVDEAPTPRQDGRGHVRKTPAPREVEAPGSEEQTPVTPRGEAGRGGHRDARPGPIPSAGGTPAEKPAAAAPSAESAERVVRVTAASLSRLLGLAGESLIQSRRLRPMVETLRELKGRQSRLIETLDALEEHVGGDRDDGRALTRDLLARLRAQAAVCEQGLLDKVEEIEDFARAGEDLSGRLHHEVLASRMRPLSDGLRGFPRMVRDVSRQLGKSVELRIVGEGTGVDRDILDKLEAPLNHLIRNAMDHGIEPPEERVAAGKPAAGTIRLEARHRAGMLQITLADDGRGIDPGKLRAKVVARGLASQAMAAQLSEAELLEFLFLPGFSTRESVTEMSGRGVGLDVVQTMVRAVGGVVRIATQPGRGTRFILHLPITRSVIRALLVRVAGEPYAFPLSRIDRIVRLADDEIRVLEGRRHFAMDDQPVGLIEAAQVLDLPPLPGTGASDAGGGGPGPHAGALPVVVVSDRSHRFGLVVDAFLGERDLEVRPLDPRLGKVPDVSSASVLDNGTPVLILDVEDLVQSIDNLLGGRRLRAISAPEGAAAAAAARGPKRVLVVDDSITVRELERQLLEARGYGVDVAVDGVDGWNAVRSGHYQLVISDVDMPRMDGIALVRAIKGDARIGPTPVIIVSYKEREEDRMRGLDAGADAYLTKSSFQDQTLLDTVADLIGEPHG